MKKHGLQRRRLLRSWNRSKQGVWSKTYVGSMVYPRRPTTTGKASTAEWKPPTSSDSRSLKTRTDGSNKCMPSCVWTTAFWKTLSKKALTTGVRRELVDYARQEHDSSLRRACRLIGISDSSYRYRPMMNKDHAVIAGYKSQLNVIRRTALANYFTFCVGKATHGITNACIGCIVN